MRLNSLDKDKIKKLTIFISTLLLISGISLVALALFKSPQNGAISDLKKMFKQDGKQFSLKDRAIDIYYNKLQPSEKNNNIVLDLSRPLLSDFISKAKKTKPAGDFLFLILFQNDLELRPTGGYIGSYGILEIKNFEFSSIQVFDTVNLDSNSTFAEIAPLALQKYLKITRLQMRDSNWDPDFEKSASQALYFYKNESGDSRSFDGVVGINTKILEELVELIKPFVVIKSGGKTFSPENIVLELEKEVEISYLEKNTPRASRKEILNSLANYIIKNLLQLVSDGKITEGTLYNFLAANFQRKNILLFLTDPDLNKKFKSLDLIYDIGKTYSPNYVFAVVDANMNSLKSNFFIKRASEYILDTTKNLVTLRLKYTNLAIQKSWFNRDYLSYTRLYIPRNLRLIDTTLDRSIPIVFEDYNQNFQSLGFPIYVPLKNKFEVEFVFEVTSGRFWQDNKNNINIIKQPGLHNENVIVKVVYPDNERLRGVKSKNKGNIYFSEPRTIVFDFVLTIDEDISLLFDA